MTSSYTCLFVDNIVEEDEVVPEECKLTDSEDDVNDDIFHYDKNENERISVELNEDRMY